MKKKNVQYILWQNVKWHLQALPKYYIRFVPPANKCKLIIIASISPKLVYLSTFNISRYIPSALCHYSFSSKDHAESRGRLDYRPSLLSFNNFGQLSGS